MIKNKTTEFYMLGWVLTFDLHYIFNFLVHETTENRGHGTTPEVRMLM